MKKHNLLKAIGVLFLLYVVLTWIIPGGSFSSGTFTKGSTTPLGFGDLFLYPIATSVYQMFILSALVVLAIGGFYGVLNKTGVFASMVEGLSKKFKGKELLFIALTTIFYALASAGLNLSLPLFLIIPFSVAVLRTLNFSKIKSFLATFGAIIVGGMSSFVGYNMDGYNYVNYFLGVEIKQTILYSVILFVLTLAILLVFVLIGNKKDIKTEKIKKGSKKDKEEEPKKENVIPLYDKDKKASKKPTVGVILFVVAILVVFVSMFNWSALGIDIFETVYTKITTVTINDFAIFQKLLGSISAFGYWGNYELVMVVLLTSIVIAWVYKVSANDTIDAFISGANKMVPVAILVIFANLLLYTINSTQTPFFQTIVNTFIGGASKFNYFAIAGLSAIGSIFYSSYPYLLFSVYDPITSLMASDVNIISITIQAIYGIVSLIVPTSVMLVLGLKYLDISYKEWLKYIWKVVLALLVVVTIAILIMSMI